MRITASALILPSGVGGASGARRGQRRRDVRGEPRTGRSRSGGNLGLGAGDGVGLIDVEQGGALTATGENDSIGAC